MRQGGNSSVNTDLLSRLVRSLLGLLRELQREIKAIRENQQTNNNQIEPQRPFPITLDSELPLPIAIREYYEAEQRNRQSLWFRIKPGLEIFGIVVAFALALFTYLTLREVKKQTPRLSESAAATARAAKAAQDQVGIMQSGQRPWLGLDGQPTLEHVTPFRLLPISPPNKTGISCDIDETFVFHNYGMTPAFDEHSDVMLFVPQAGETGIKPEGPFNCRTTDADIAHGEVIFPGSSVRAGFHIQPASVYLLKSTRELRRIWLLGCISYRDGDRKIHNTKFWLRCTFSDGTAWITLTPDFRYMPILGFESWGEEAN
jgi:hypothetical protein